MDDANREYPVYLYAAKYTGFFITSMLSKVLKYGQPTLKNCCVYCSVSIVFVVTRYSSSSQTKSTLHLRLSTWLSRRRAFNFERLYLRKNKKGGRRGEEREEREADG